MILLAVFILQSTLCRNEAFLTRRSSYSYHSTCDHILTSTRYGRLGVGSFNPAIVGFPPFGSQLFSQAGNCQATRLQTAPLPDGAWHYIRFGSNLYFPKTLKMRPTKVASGGTIRYSRHYIPDAGVRQPSDSDY